MLLRVSALVRAALVGACVLGVSEGVALREEVRQDLVLSSTSCGASSLTETDEWLEKLGVLRSSIAQCGANIGAAEGFTANLILLTDSLHDSINANEFDAKLSKLESFKTDLNKLFYLASFIPGFGPVVKVVRKIVDAVLALLLKLFPALRILLEVGDKIETLNGLLGNLEESTSVASWRIELLEERYTNLRAAVADDGCACSSVLNQHSAGTVDAEAYDTALASYQVCIGFFDPLEALPDLDIDIGWLSTLEGMLDAWETGILDALNEVADKVRNQTNARGQTDELNLFETLPTSKRLGTRFAAPTAWRRRRTSSRTPRTSPRAGLRRWPTTPPAPSCALWRTARWTL